MWHERHGQDGQVVIVQLFFSLIVVVKVGHITPLAMDPLLFCRTQTFMQEMSGDTHKGGAFTSRRQLHNHLYQIY